MLGAWCLVKTQVKSQVKTRVLVDQGPRTFVCQVADKVVSHGARAYRAEAVEFGDGFNFNCGVCHWSLVSGQWAVGSC